MMGALSAFSTIVTVIGVLMLAYWCSRLLGKRWGQNTCSGNMRVLESIQVGQDRRILLLGVADHHYLIGVSQAGVQLLAELEGDFIADMPPGPGGTGPFSFQELLERYWKNRNEKDGVD